MVVNNKNQPTWSISLWDYSVKIYGFKEVKKSCLKLQDEYHANVAIILWCCWLNSEGITLPQSVMDEALINIDTVNQTTLLKLRSVRRSVEGTGAFTSDQAKVINRQVLNIELMIEKVLLYRLQDLTRRFIDLPLLSETPVTLSYYLQFINIESASEEAEKLQQLCNLRSVVVDDL
ncbi:MAG: TIGR02444 family protein [Cellvibrionaceae bacterium]|nr:TIGR02444 family protein [Cellvibrionaceae bacterium]